MQNSFYHIPGLPVSIALLADLHEKDFSFLSGLYPVDLIAIAGDILYGSAPEDGSSASLRAIPFLSACSSKAPTYLSLGNHEWMLDREDLALIEENGVTVLDNRWVSREGLCIGGLSSGIYTDYQRFRTSKQERYPLREVSHRKEAPMPETDWLSAYEKQPGFKILLSHHPEYWKFLEKRPIDLVLSGHAHGGQIRLFGHGLFAPGQGWWPELTSGVHDGRLVISRGLSNTAPLVPRLFNPTQIVYLLPGV
jgi:predicted MPP superfamily phosphohydrolase